MTKPKIQLHMVMNTIDDKRFDIAITRIARYYENEMYDEYEDAIAYYAKNFKKCCTGRQYLWISFQNGIGCFLNCLVYDGDTEPQKAGIH